MQKGRGTTGGKRQIEFTLLELAFEIIQKYTEETEITGYLLLKMSNQKLNAFLKTIPEICDIDKKITYYIARHTFATICLEQGIPLYTVSKLPGHSDLKTTQNYARVTNSILAKSAEKLNQALE